MGDSSNKLIYLLWSVIGVLLIGAGLGVFILLRHAGAVDKSNTQLMGDNDSLKRQVQEARAAIPSPTATPIVSTPAAPAAAAARTPTPTR